MKWFNPRLLRDKGNSKEAIISQDDNTFPLSQNILNNT